jgi:hypothetical protein
MSNFPSLEPALTAEVSELREMTFTEIPNAYDLQQIVLGEPMQVGRFSESHERLDLHLEGNVSNGAPVICVVSDTAPTALST